MLGPVGHDDFPGWVEQLADPLRARRAYWHLVLSGSSALPAIRVGLRHAHADVRDLCTQALDHLVDDDLMRRDPNRHVRAMAVEVVGRWVHTDQEATAALIDALHADPDPTVRKKAGWYAPGGPIYLRTRRTTADTSI
jgi:hypothetical protein